MGIELAQAFVRVSVDTQQAEQQATRSVGNIEATLGRLEQAVWGAGARMESAIARTMGGPAVRDIDEGPKKAEGSWRSLGATLLGAAKWVAGIAGVAYTVNSLIGVFKEGERVSDEWEKALDRMRVTFELMGDAANTAFGAVEAKVQELDQATLANANDMRRAATQLAAYSELARGSFDSIMTLSVNMAQVTGMSVAQIARLLGRAIEDPVQALSMFRRSMREFPIPENIKETVKELDKMGDSSRAAMVLFGYLQTRYSKGAAKMKATPSGYEEDLEKQLERAKRAMGDSWDAAEEGFIKFKIWFYGFWGEVGSGIVDIASYAADIWGRVVAVWEATLGPFFTWMADNLGSLLEKLRLITGFRLGGKSVRAGFPVSPEQQAEVDAANAEKRRKKREEGQPKFPGIIIKGVGEAEQAAMRREQIEQAAHALAIDIYRAAGESEAGLKAIQKSWEKGWNTEAAKKDLETLTGIFKEQEQIAERKKIKEYLDEMERGYMDVLSISERVTDGMRKYMDVFELGPKGLAKQREELEAIAKIEEEMRKWQEKHPEGTAEDEARAREILEGRAREERKQRVQREGEQLYTEMQTPVEILNDALANLEFLQGEGAISAETARRARWKARREYISQTGISETRMGFADYGKRIQDLIIKAYNPETQLQTRIANAAEAALGVQRQIAEGLLTRENKYGAAFTAP